MPAPKYSKGDKIFHPIYGAATIDDIEQKTVDGETKLYYVLEVPIKNLRVSASVDKMDSKMRPLYELSDLEKKITGAKSDFQAANWNILFEQNKKRVKSGDITEVASVFKYLSKKEKKRPLSSMEKKMMWNAKQIVLSELSLSGNLGKEKAESMLENLIRPNKPKMT